MRKTTLQPHSNYSSMIFEKAAGKKTGTIPKMTSFGNVANFGILQKLQSLQDGKFGARIKLYNHITVDLCEKSLKETANIPKMTSFGRVAKLINLQTLQALQNAQFGARNEVVKSMRKRTPQPHYSSMIYAKREFHAQHQYIKLPRSTELREEKQKLYFLFNLFCFRICVFLSGLFQGSKSA